MRLRWYLVPCQNGGGRVLWQVQARKEERRKKVEKKRAVAYIRVSTAQSAQMHSFEFQEAYWKQALEENPDVELVGIYADRGISGSGFKKRPRFLEMVEDALDGEFDVIYTKSISRFSRNSVELLEVVHKLRDKHVEVVFENENIHTLDSGTDLLLTIAASIAENDLLVDSQRQKWSIQKRIEEGWISIGSGLFGYKMCDDNILKIVPDEAEIVRKIFKLYTEGKGSTIIARILNENGCKTRAGNPWTARRIMGVLENEKYSGDSIMGKSVKINGKDVNNKSGEYGNKYLIENSHDPIVSKEIFNKAQEIRANKNKNKRPKGTVAEYPFTGMIVCGQCNKSYRHKINNSGRKWQTAIWMCGTQSEHGMEKCDCTRIKDSVLKEKFVECYNEFIETKPQGNKEIEYEVSLSRLSDEEHELAVLAMRNMIPMETFRAEKKRITEKRRELSMTNKNRRKKTVNPKHYKKIAEFDENIMKQFITKVIINKNMVTFVFYNGVKISRAYTNGQPGNQKGWNRR